MSKTTVSLAFLLILSCTTVLVLSQAIIPSRYDGFVYRKHAASTATVMIEAFYDPVCPDSRDSWAPLKQAVDHYGPKVVSLIVHTFPLPYHDNAFMTSRALHIVNELNASATYHLLGAFFKHQHRWITLNETLVLVPVFESLNPDVMADFKEFPRVLDANPMT
nr:putative thioredoxin superfamily protein [Tanacetum cinerariifolium]